MDEYFEIDILVGKILSKVEVIGDDEEIVFTTVDGEIYKLYHEPDCCESVLVDDIHGDLNDLVDSPIVRATKDTNEDENPEGVKVPEYQDSFTWTFYNIATAKGHVTIRWYGESNGYYSEGVEFIKVAK